MVFLVVFAFFEVVLGRVVIFVNGIMYKEILLFLIGGCVCVFRFVELEVELDSKMYIK